MRNERTDEMAERMIGAVTDATPPALRQFAVYEFGVPTGPERMHVWVSALDRRIEQLERALLDAGHRIAVLEHRLALLEDAEVRA
ncbi:MAG: hypothetical protein KAX65_04685 [Caldilineaceae bacterium]|nr:hypothetical protein [Caldilineaceae bacterium]